MLTFTTDEIKIKINETSKIINSLFKHYQKGYIDIRELDFACNQAINILYENIYCNTVLNTSEIMDYLTDIKIKVYSELINLYKKRAEEKNKF